MSIFDLDVGLHSIVCLSGTVERRAFQLLPTDNLLLNQMPLVVGADGNCFPRPLSMLVFVDEEQHLDMKTISGKFKRWKNVTGFKLVPDYASKELRNGTLPLQQKVVNQPT